MVLEKIEPIGTLTEKVPGERRCLCTALRIERAEVRDRFLADSPSLTNGTYEAPVRVRLAVLLHFRMPQVHARVSFALLIHGDVTGFNRVSWHYIANSGPRRERSTISTRLTSTQPADSVENRSDFSQTVQVGLTAWVPRLPRLLTDQTLAVSETESLSPQEHLRRFLALLQPPAAPRSDA